MIEELTNHLWQSTLVAIVAGLLAVAFRNDRAAVRHWLWFSASLKFFVPFALLINIGRHLGWVQATDTVAVSSVSFRMEQFTQPFPHTSRLALSTTASVAHWLPLVCLGIWACGFGFIAVIRFRGWRSIRAALRSSNSIDIPAPVEVRSSPGLLEPGVVGFFRPVLLFPAGIADRLTPRQLQAVLAHELCHIRRRDNFTSAIHMAIEAVFWFYPLVWWIGARLVEERERACDEAVLSLGNQPRDYAEGILHVCKSYLDSPLSCVSGVTSSSLKKRIQAILAGRVAPELAFTKKLMLVAVAMAALGLPIVIGAISTPPMLAQSAPRNESLKFETVSISPCEAFRGNTPDSWSSGTFRSQCTTVDRLVQQAYGLFATGHMNAASSLTVSGGPPWTASDLYEIDAKPPGPQGHAMMNGPMLQALLEDRFKLKVHRETREVPVYTLTVAPGGPHLEPFQGTCTPRNFDDPPSETDCGTARGYGNGLFMKAATVTDLCAGFSVLLDRPVLDKTGISGRFNLHLDLSSEHPELLRPPRSLPALSNPTKPAPPPINFEAAKAAMKSLGLDLESTEGPGEFIVIDQVERPPRT